MTEQDYVAWCRYTDQGPIVTCDSDAPGAFKVHRWKGDQYMPTMDEAYRFMASNPLTSQEMMDEIRAKAEGARKGESK